MEKVSKIGSEKLRYSPGKTTTQVRIAIVRIPDRIDVQVAIRIEVGVHHVTIVTRTKP